MSGENPKAKAIYETATMVATAKAETRKRGFWGYIQVAELERWAKDRPWPGGVIPKTDEVLARIFFGVRLDAPVVCAPQGGAPMFAVWRKTGEPTVEPSFDENIPDEVQDTPSGPAYIKYGPNHGIDGLDVVISGPGALHGIDPAFVSEDVESNKTDDKSD